MGTQKFIFLPVVVDLHGKGAGAGNSEKWSRSNTLKNLVCYAERFQLSPRALERYGRVLRIWFHVELESHFGCSVETGRVKCRVRRLLVDTMLHAGEITVFVRKFLVASDRNSPWEPTLGWLHTHPPLETQGRTVPDEVWNNWNKGLNMARPLAISHCYCLLPDHFAR